MESGSPRRPPLTDCNHFSTKLFTTITSPSGEPNVDTISLVTWTHELHTASVYRTSANFFFSQHLQKLKRKEGGGNPGKKAATPGKKRGKAATEGDDEESPKKKQRKTPAKAASRHADDHDDDEGVELQLKNEEE